MSKLLLDILSVKKYIFSNEMPLRNFDVFDNFIWRTTQKFHSIYLSTGETKHTREKFKFLFETIQTENLITDIKIGEPDFSTYIPLRRYDSLFLKECNWLSIDNLLEAKAKDIDVKFVTPVSPDDAIKILKTWIEGTKLKEMTLMEVGPLSSKENVMKQADMLGGVSRCNDPKAFENRRQMKRVTDGKIAVFHIVFNRLTIRIL
ncbi:hypothetical protein CAEBREN_09001 [Caenorhabditis brenneri]|uniref:Sdz-33 F-box domain-containing protein n=1 Tax=Caenorhabditis brenneri TaxID=135651 RepID=G0NHU3_CAEBE|nr:hypothetical protein CAEBREN_09001 [Caenorhabditis brenneri]